MENGHNYFNYKLQIAFSECDSNIFFSISLEK